MFVERSWTTADGLRLSARDYPGAAGPARLPVICLHGLTRNARDFEAVAPAIAATGRRVLALDMRGRGLSAHDPAPMNYTVPTYVADVIGWAGALGIARAVFVGTSMGGLITLVLAAAAPSLVAAAVLNDVGPELAPEGLARIAAYVGSGGPVSDWAAAADATRRTQGLAFPTYQPKDWDAFARRLYRERDGRIALDYDPAIAVPLQAPEAQVIPDLWPLFDGLAAGRPLMLVRGLLSDLITADIAQKMQRRASHMSITEAADTGHAPTLTEAGVPAALARFLDAID